MRVLTNFAVVLYVFSERTLLFILSFFLFGWLSLLYHHCMFFFGFLRCASFFFVSLSSALIIALLCIHASQYKIVLTNLDVNIEALLNLANLGATATDHHADLIRVDLQQTGSGSLGRIVAITATAAATTGSAIWPRRALLAVIWPASLVATAAAAAAAVIGARRSAASLSTETAAVALIAAAIAARIAATGRCWTAHGARLSAVCAAAWATSWAASTAVVTVAIATAAILLLLAASAATGMPSLAHGDNVVVLVVVVVMRMLLYVRLKLPKR